jgi:hypothetical protein
MSSPNFRNGISVTVIDLTQTQQCYESEPSSQAFYEDENGNSQLDLHETVAGVVCPPERLMNAEDLFSAEHGEPKLELRNLLRENPRLRVSRELQTYISTQQRRWLRNHSR